MRKRAYILNVTTWEGHGNWSAVMVMTEDLPTESRVYHA